VDGIEICEIRHGERQGGSTAAASSASAARTDAVNLGGFRRPNFNIEVRAGLARLLDPPTMIAQLLPAIVGDVVIGGSIDNNLRQLAAGSSARYGGTRPRLIAATASLTVGKIASTLSNCTTSKIVFRFGLIPARLKTPPCAPASR
jgi:hypothetical protein